MDRSGRGEASKGPAPPRLHVTGVSGHQHIVVPTSGVLGPAGSIGELGDLSRITWDEGKEIMDTFNYLKGE